MSDLRDLIEREVKELLTGDDRPEAIRDAFTRVARAAAEAGVNAVINTDDPGPACMNVKVPPTIADDDDFREPYCQGYRHALHDVKRAVAAVMGDE